MHSPIRKGSGTNENTEHKIKKGIIHLGFSFNFSIIQIPAKHQNNIGRNHMWIYSYLSKSLI